MHQEYQSAIEACVQCARECDHCAEVILGESPAFSKLCFDCAPTCWSAASYLSRRSPFAPDVVELCADICEVCAREFEKSAAQDLQRCAEACRRCAAECRHVAAAAV